MNNRWVWYLIGITAITLIAAAVIRQLTPQAPVIPTTDFVLNNRDGSRTQFSNMTFVGTPPEFPKQISIAQVQPTDVTEEAIKNQLLQTYNLTAHSKAPSLWINPPYSLSFTRSTHQYILLNNTPISSTSGQFTKINQTQAVQQAQQLLLQIVPNIPLVAQTESIQFIASEDETRNAPPTEAPLIEIPFAYAVDGYPVMYEKNTEFPFSVVLTASYDLKKLTFLPQFIAVKPLQKTSLISLDAAVANINSNKGSIIYSVSQGSPSFTLDSLSSGRLTSVMLEYRVDPTLNLAYPFYRFAGTAITSQNETVKIEVITPAVETTLSL
jgi:hypothetical protein